jgi:dihydroflavonol-4-reductase
MPQAVDAVFHVAGNVALWSRRNGEQTRDNVIGARNMATVALERGAGRFIYTSSIAAFGMHDELIDESTPSNAQSSWINYFRTKALAEQEVLRGVEAGLDAVILNPANIIGPYDLKNWSTLLYLVHNRKLPGVPPGRGSFCHVREVVRAHLAAVEHGRTGENYLLVLRLLARMSVLQAGITGRRPMLTPEMAHVLCRDMICSNVKAIRELGYRPAPLEEMLTDCYCWMLAEGRLKTASAVSRARSRRELASQPGFLSGASRRGGDLGRGMGGRSAPGQGRVVEPAKIGVAAAEDRADPGASNRT